MASSSSLAGNSQCPQWKYDVFLNFRGEDTRKKFTAHLYEGLRNRGIVTFLDDKRLEHGKSIPNELFEAIEGSQFAVVIFSENYASSTWCLNELVKIMECYEVNQFGQTLVIPIFYDVDPSTVRKLSGSFATAFSKHEKDNKDVEGMEKVKRWRTAVTAAANLKGYDIRQGIDSEHINKIVDQISSKVQKTSVSYLKDVVGIDTHLENVKSLLEMQTNDVRIVGIWGMGGIGKTTLARAIFVTLSHTFEGFCFLADVKENKLHSLQNILLSELLGRKDDYVNNKEDGKALMARRLCSKRVLIVLDDIDDRDHLYYLAGDPCWFGKGSRVIATTRDKHLIGKNVVYEMTTMAGPEAIRLFNQYAFKKEVPDVLFEELTLEAVSHAKGLPLALKVWGSMLYNRDITEWISAIELMKNSSNSEIVEKLKISYDRLDTIQQEVFLDIACCLRGIQKVEIKNIPENCNFETDMVLRILINRSLIFISEHMIEMHDLIQDMGKYIVNMQKDPVKRSRLWLVEDFKKVMTKNTGTEAVEAIWIRGPEQLSFSKEAMRNMERLRILSIGVQKCLTHDGSIVYLPNSLRWFVWWSYPWESLPENFEPERLVHLELWDSSLCHLWTGIKHLPCLRTLYLKESERLKRTPDFTGMPNLEYLDLRWCTNLEEVHPSLVNCRKLIELHLFKCKSLKSLPEEIGDLENLEKLDAGYTLISRPPLSIVRLNKLKFLSFAKRDSVSFLFPPVAKGLRSLEILNLSGCDLRDAGPLEDIGCLSSLKKLDLSGNNFEHLPQSIAQLSALESLDLRECKSLTQLPEDIGCLSSLEELYLSGNNFEHLPQSIAQLSALESLDLDECKSLTQLPEDIGCLSSLKNLDLRGNNFEHLPQSIAQLSALQSLDLRECKSLTQLPELPPELYKLSADCQLALQSFHNLVTMKKLPWVVLSPLYDKDEAYNDWIYNSFARTLFQNMSSFQYDITASNSLSERLFTIGHPWKKIPSWFHYQGMNEIDLPENWYICDSFLGFAICYSGCYELRGATVGLIPLCNDGMSWMTQKLAYHPECGPEYTEEYSVRFLFVPFAGLWDESKANGKTPNDYGRIRIWFSRPKELGIHLLYKDEPELEALLQMRENNDEPDNIEPHDSATNEASCSLGHILISVGVLLLRICSNK